MEKGVVIEIYDHELEKTIFKYFNKNTKPYVTIEEVNEWEEKTIAWVLNDDRYDYITYLLLEIMRSILVFL